MRVAVHFPAEHPLSGGEDSVAAFRLGRIEDGVHNAPVGHAPVPLDEFVTRLVKQAQEEYPDADVVVERLIDNGDETSSWIPAEDFDPDEHTPVGSGQTVQREVTGSLSATSEGGA